MKRNTRRIAHLILGLILCFPLVNGWAQDPDELLEPDAAFALSTQVIDDSTLEASWKVAKGYYMYRDKFKFEVINGQARLLEPEYPPGKIKVDPNFDNQAMETYAKAVSVRLPLARSDAAAETLTLRITAQGCNEPVGVCYAPITKEADFALPLLASAEQTAGDDAVPASLTGLRELLEGDAAGQEFLPPDEAFQLFITQVDDGMLEAEFVIAEGYYLYRDKIRFVTGQGTELSDYTLPPGKSKHDEYFGETQVYYHGMTIPLPLSAALKRETVVNAEYQGCAEGGICYAPISKTVTIDSGTNAGFFIVMFWAFGAGLLLTFTGCVLPMIPILMSVIVGQGDKSASALRGGSLAVFYVLGTSVTWTAVGVAAGQAGVQLQAYFQNIYAIGIFSLILVLMALAMFDLYTIQMPASIQSRLQGHAQKIKGGSYIGVFVLGLISALIVGACVSPILGAMLTGAMAAQDPVLGGAVMFSAAWGMGVLLIAMGLGADSVIPKAGVWMNRVKHAFGVILIGVAIYLLGYLPQVPVLYLWAGLLIITSIYFGALEAVPTDASGWRYFFKGLGILMLLWGTLALIGGFSGNRDILRPLPMSFDSTVATSTGMPTGEETGHVFERVTSLSALEQRLASAKATGKPVILDYFATWCADCVRMEKSTFADPRVRQVLAQRFVALQVDVTDPNDAQGNAIKQKFNVFGPPAMLFFGADGGLRKDLNFYGYKNRDDFLRLLEQL